MNTLIPKIIYNMCWSCRQLDADIKEDFLVRIGDVFGIERQEASHLYTLLLQCMDHRQSVSEIAFMNECICVMIGHTDFLHHYVCLNNR